MAATVIAAVVATFAVVIIFKHLLSTEDGRSNTESFYRRALRAVPIQALKIIVVVWQIVTQVRSHRACRSMVQLACTEEDISQVKGADVQRKNGASTSVDGMCCSTAMSHPNFLLPYSVSLVSRPLSLQTRLTLPTLACIKTF